jgi:hypothetical protein
MEATLQSDRKTARLAAALFLFVCVPLSIWDGMYVPGKIFVAQDPVATANNLLANEFMFRTAILSHLIGFMTFMLMILLFVRVFRPVDKHLGRLMAVFVVAPVPVIFIFEVMQYMALMVLKGDARPSFDVAQQQEAAYFLLRMYRYAIGPGLGKFFLGLCFIPFGMLVLRSGYAPRVIGILLLTGGVGYLADSCIAILLQRADYVVVRPFLMWTTLAYFAAFIWFLIKGVRDPKAVANR